MYVRPFPAVDLSRATVSTSGGRQPAWSQNGREFFYTAARGALMAASVETPRGSTAFVAGAPVKLHDGSTYYDAGNTPSRGRTYDVLPDGTRFLRIKQEESQASAARGSLVVVVNWFEELKRLVPAN